MKKSSFRISIEQAMVDAGISSSKLNKVTTAYIHNNKKTKRIKFCGIHDRNKHEQIKQQVEKKFPNLPVKVFDTLTPSTPNWARCWTGLAVRIGWGEGNPRPE